MTHSPGRASGFRRAATFAAAVALAATSIAVNTAAPVASGAGPVEVFDDMEHGDPFANGWFSFNGAVGGGGIAPNDTDLPPSNGGAFSLETGWGAGGTAGFYGGFGRGNPTDLTGLDTFNFWINPDAGQDYTLEVNLQETDDGTGVADEFQFDCTVGAAGPCATSGGGWQLVSIPLASFVDDNSFVTGGDGVLGVDLAAIVLAVIGGGSDVNFRTDYWAFSDGPLDPNPSAVVDDFDSGLPFGSAVPNGEPLGFYTFQDGGSSIALSTTSTPPEPVPSSDAGNVVLQMDVDAIAFAGYIHAFENAAVDTWVTQDWSTSEGIRFWMYGTNSGTQMFIDILDNRNPGSTADDAERWTVPFADDFTGWKLLEFPFPSFVRKEIGNGAPNDGLGLFAMHGYAIGTLGTGELRTFYFDDVSVYGVAEPPALAVNLSRQNTFVTEGETGEVAVKLNRPMGPDDPAQVSIDFATERSYAVAGEEYVPTSGTLTFVNGGPNELTFPVQTFDDTKFEGDEQIVIRLTNPVDVERGALFQGSVLIDDDDPFDPLLLDDFEQGAFLWDATGDATVTAERVEETEPGARPGQDAAEFVGVVSTPIAVDIDVQGPVCTKKRGVVPIHLLSTDAFDATSVDHTTVTFGGASETHVDRRTGEAHRHVDDVNDDGLDDLVIHVRATEIDCSDEPALAGETFDGRAITTGGSDAAIVRDFPAGQDWTGAETIDLWFEGTGSGDEITVTLKNDRAPDPGPAGWTLAWSDEFDEPEGTPPNPANWAYEIGDTTPDGKNGWGNEELQYYTDDPDNAATDGAGNLVITLDAADGSQECYYGPCEFESARLITQNKAEFAYGRIESRLQVPTGGDGLWPAFWSLGTDITYNPWPGAGEIDIMEYVSRLPNEIFGTIHGPGYSGGNSFSGIYADFGGRVDADYHTYAVEWEPEKIRWYIDGILYHEAAPSDVAPNPWVFEKPFFLLLNFAIGGNFGGAIDPANTYPQEYLVDYVRVYQGPDTAERFETTFVDDVAGWQEVSIPLSTFERSGDQPDGAPDNGLNLDEIWGYGFEFPNGTTSGEVTIDLVRRVQTPPPSELVVTSLDDAGDGSLRDALSRIADGGTITFDPALAGGTLTLGSGQLVIDRSVTVDAAAAAPVTISAGGSSRVVQVTAGADVTMNDLVLRDGVAGPQGGGVLNLGSLTLERVTVTNNLENSTGTSFDLGGGGIYNGENAVLNLVDSVVSDNATVAQPGGGIYGFFGSTINVTDSIVSGNVGGDVAGGFRTLGDVTITGSTITDNVSSLWHGGALFMTDGTVLITDSVITGNTAPPGTAGGLMVATFGAPVSVSVGNSVVTNNGTYSCQVEGDPGVAVLTSLGGNTFSDASCNPGPTDTVLP